MKSRCPSLWRSVVGPVVVVTVVVVATTTVVHGFSPTPLGTCTTPAVVSKTHQQRLFGRNSITVVCKGKEQDMDDDDPGTATTTTTPNQTDRLSQLGYSTDEIQRSQQPSTDSSKNDINVNVNLLPEVDAVTLTAVGFGLIACNFFIFANMGDGGIAGLVASAINLAKQ